LNLLHCTFENRSLVGFEEVDGFSVPGEAVGVVSLWFYPVLEEGESREGYRLLSVASEAFDTHNGQVHVEDAPLVFALFFEFDAGVSTL
jgi:hypothetical protein